MKISPSNILIENFLISEFPKCKDPDILVQFHFKLRLMPFLQKCKSKIFIPKDLKLETTDIKRYGSVSR